jgi:hypothetical protein
MFRFTIRDVLWLTVVVAMAVALWVNRKPSIVHVLPHELSKLCQPGQMVKVTVLQDGYKAESADGSQVQRTRITYK